MNKSKKQENLLKPFLLVFIGFMLLIFDFSLAQSFDAITYNIRYDNPNDGLDNWNHRKQEMLKFLNEMEPLVLGIQEGLHHQVAYLNDGLADYAYIGVGRDDGMTKGEYCAVFYDSTELKLLEDGTFWLSEQPDIVSIGWDAALERICTYGLFKTETGSRFWVFNTHFDHKGPEARFQSSALIVKMIQQLNVGSYPVILMGDFNATPDQPLIQNIAVQLEDSWSFSSPKGPAGTFNGFEGKPVDRRIDYIFTSDLTVNYCEHVDARTKNGRNLSDHLPVVVNFEF